MARKKKGGDFFSQWVMSELGFGNKKENLKLYTNADKQPNIRWRVDLTGSQILKSGLK